MDEVMKKIREINRRNRLLKNKYKGDERFVRIHKRIEEQNEKRERPIISKQEYEIAENLINMKEDIDRMIFLDVNKLDNAPAFLQDVLAIIGKELLKMHIRADLKDRKFINNLITNEYFVNSTSKCKFTESFRKSTLVVFCNLIFSLVSC